jgi:hypothetical protein
MSSASEQLICAAKNKLGCAVGAASAGRLGMGAWLLLWTFEERPCKQLCLEPGLCCTLHKLTLVTFCRKYFTGTEDQIPAQIFHKCRCLPPLQLLGWQIRTCYFSPCKCALTWWQGLCAGIHVFYCSLSLPQQLSLRLSILLRGPMTIYFYVFCRDSLWWQNAPH